MRGWLDLERALVRTRIVLVFVVLAGACVFSPASAQSGPADYTYDAVGRITSARYDAGFRIVYTYDANGNRLTQVVDLNSGDLAWTSIVPPCTSNCWDGAPWGTDSGALHWTATIPPCTSNCWGDALWKN